MVAKVGSVTTSGEAGRFISILSTLSALKSAPSVIAPFDDVMASTSSIFSSPLMAEVLSVVDESNSMDKGVTDGNSSSRALVVSANGLKELETDSWPFSSIIFSVVNRWLLVNDSLGSVVVRLEKLVGTSFSVFFEIFVTVGIKSSGFRALGLPKRFFEWPVRLPNCSCNTVNSSKLTPTSFSSSSRTCLIKAPSTSAKPHLFARIGGNDKMESIS